MLKGKLIGWKEFQEQEKNQTIVQVTYKFQDREDFTRILIGNFKDRREAWLWCKQENISKSKVGTGKGQESIQTEIKLYDFKKVLKRLEQEHPKEVSAWVLDLATTGLDAFQKDV